MTGAMRAAARKSMDAMTMRAAPTIFPRDQQQRSPGGFQRMSVDLGELFASVEEEFDVPLDTDATRHMSPRELVEHIVENMPEPGERMDDEERRDYIDSVLGELMAQVLGITRYDEEMPFHEIVRSARRK